MKQNQKNRYNGRYRTSGYRPQNITRNTALDSNGPAGKLHGTALQLFEKYQSFAKDFLIQNDTVLAETHLQFADHYARLQNMAIANEENARSYVKPNPQHTSSESTTTPVTDELPDFGTPSEIVPMEIPTDEMSEEDKALKKMDLSIPILAIQEKHYSEKQPQRPKRYPPKKKNPETVIA